MNEENKTFDVNQQMGDPRDELAEQKLREQAERNLEKFLTKIKAEDGEYPALVIPLSQREDRENLKLKFIVDLMAKKYGNSLAGQDISNTRFDYLMAMAAKTASTVIELGGIKQLIDDKPDAIEQIEEEKKNAKKWKYIADRYGKLLGKLADDKVLWAEHATKEEKIEKLAEKSDHTVKELEEKSDDYLQGLLESAGYVEDKGDSDMSKGESEKVRKAREEAATLYEGGKMNDENYVEAVKTVAEDEGEDWDSLSDVEKARFRKGHQKEIKDRFEAKKEIREG